MRRALRHGKILGMELPFLYKLVDVVVDNYKVAYPELEKNKEKIIDTIKKEEERFNKTLDRGYKLLEDFIAKKQDIDGENAFKLYDTLGFPFELTKEIAEENGLKVDEAGFKQAMQEQKARAKAATQKISLTDDLKYVAIENEFGSTEFIGYEKDSCNNAKVSPSAYNNTCASNALPISFAARFSSNFLVTSKVKIISSSSISAYCSPSLSITGIPF